MEEYHEDYEYDHHQDYNNDIITATTTQSNTTFDQVVSSNQMNGYYNNTTQDTTSVITSTANGKLTEDQFYNTYDECMVFNEEDEDLYREQLETGKIVVPIPTSTSAAATSAANEMPLEEYKEDFEEDFLPIAVSSHPMSTISSSMAGGDGTQNNIYVTAAQPFTSIAPPIKQDSFDDYNDPIVTSSSASASKPHATRMLTKQDTIMSETTDMQYNDFDEDHHHLEQQESLDKYYEDEEEQYQQQEKEQQQKHQEELPKNDLNEIQTNVEILPPARKSVTIEEPVKPVKHEKPKEKMSAKQRWHWAYNKIIMQLNVSRNLFLFCYFLSFSLNYLATIMNFFNLRV